MREHSIHYLILAYLLVTWNITGCSIDGIFSETLQEPTHTIPPTNTSHLLPDLEIKKVTSKLDNTRLCEPNRERIQIQVVIKNSGDAVSNDFTVQVNDSDQVVKDKLEPGTETSLWFPGEEIAEIQVDVSEDVNESDETNNCLTQKIKIPFYPPQCFQTPTPESTVLNPTHILEGHTAEVLSLDFSPDGNLIASGSVDNTMRIWDVRQARLMRTMHGHPFPVLSLKFTPNGSFIVTGSTDGIGRIWRVSNGDLVGDLQGHAGWLNSLDISLDGGLIATCADDYTVRVWRFMDAKQIQTIDEGMSIVSQVAFTPGGKELAWAENNGDVRVRSLDGSWLHVIQKSHSPASSLAITPDAEILVSGHSDGKLKVWDLEDGTLLYELSGHSDHVSSLVFSPDGNWLLSGSKDGKARIWQFSNKGSIPQAKYILNGHEGPVNVVAFSPDGDLIASGSDDRTIRLWSIPEN